MNLNRGSALGVLRGLVSHLEQKAMGVTSGRV